MLGDVLPRSASPATSAVDTELPCRRAGRAGAHGSGPGGGRSSGIVLLSAEGTELLAETALALPVLRGMGIAACAVQQQHASIVKINRRIPSDPSRSRPKGFPEKDIRRSPRDPCPHSLRRARLPRKPEPATLPAAKPAPGIASFLSLRPLG